MTLSSSKLPAISCMPRGILAQGRDASATIDSGFSGMSGFQNEGDNELTGWHFSDGDASVDGLLGAKIPTPFRNGWRLFYTAQHGDNVTWEIFARPVNEDAYYGFSQSRSNQ